MVTYLNEASLESLIVEQLVGLGGSPAWHEGDPKTFDAAFGLDRGELTAFLEATQPETAQLLDIGSGGPTAQKFLARLEGEITKRGIVDVLRRGVDHLQHHVDLYYPAPSRGNAKAADQHSANRLQITRQMHYSVRTPGRSIDLVALLNGLPIVTFELKNLITGQSVEDAVAQYKAHRDPSELLFRPGRAIVHFAVDDRSVRFCTELKGNASWFLPFDLGHDDGAGNPPNPHGVATDYLWRRVLAPGSLADIIEHYAHVVAVESKKTRKKSRLAVFPRYHQLDVVRALLADVRARGAGARYLIQHSAGSGKSNSIAWLTHQLISVEHSGTAAFDTIIVVTDRIILDRQIHDTIKGFTQIASTVVHADSSADLRAAIEAGKKIIVTTAQKFPYIVAGLGTQHRDRTYGIVVDEAHSSQGGSVSAALAASLSEHGVAAAHADEDSEDVLVRLMTAKKLLPNASYFAFTATPKNKTLETFGVPYVVDGVTKRRPFHSYTMKQAIQEGFILDVLSNYVAVDAYYKLVKVVEDDPEFDARRANKKLRAFVEGQRDAIRQKAEVMADHFHEQVWAKKKIGGKARAMIVTSSIDRAIAYYEELSAYLKENRRPYQAIVAFSDIERDGAKITEAQYNGFPSAEIPDRIQDDPYRILVVADKFQTGYDEPLLHTMYVDKVLSGVKAVQTLSRLNRAHPQKHDVCVLDFAGDADAIRAAFEPYYRTTLLAEETDPNRLHDLAALIMDSAIVVQEIIDEFVGLYLNAARRDVLDPLLDACAAEYIEREIDDQIQFKSAAKSFVRAYGFLSAILPYSNVAWEKLAIFLGYLIPKLPTPPEVDFAAGIIESIDLDSFRVEKTRAMSIALADEDAEVRPVPGAGATGHRDTALERLSEIVKSFNALFGNIDWQDAERIRHRITEEVPAKVAEDPTYQTAAANNDKANAKIAMVDALGRVMLSLVRDETQLFKEYSDNADFKKWLEDAVFRATYKKSA